jgi:hypothetical protein
VPPEEKSIVTALRQKPSANSKVTLRRVTEDTVRAVCGLSVREDQKQFVATNALSIAQAYFSKYAWFRAIYADETLVGFLMLEDQPEKPEYFLWRFMIPAGPFVPHSLSMLIHEYIWRHRPNRREQTGVRGHGSRTDRSWGSNNMSEAGRVTENVVRQRLIGEKSEPH